MTSPHSFPLKTKPLALWSLAACLFVSPVSATQPEVQSGAPLLLCRGEQRLLSIAGLLRFSLGTEAVRAHLGPDLGRSSQLLLKAINPGTGDLWVWKQDGSVEKRALRVKPCRSEALNPLETALGDLEEAEIYFSGTTAILRGEIHTRAEVSRIRSLLNGFGEKIKDETLPSDELLRSELDAITRWTKASSSAAGLTATLLGREIRVTGNIEEPARRRALDSEISSRFILTSTDLSSLPDQAPTVYFRVFLLELKKDRFGSIGLTWPGSTPSAFRVTTAGIPKFQDLLQLDLALESLEGEGALKVLSRPEMAVRAPGEAELFAGGELPIQSRGRYTSQVAWKPFGLTLKLKVTHATETQVRLEIFTEVSNLDTSVGADTVPGIRSNRMKTQVDARFGSTLLLSGLLQERNRKSSRGLPLLRSLPVLGSLFGSADYLQDKSELVAILLPLRSPPEAPQSLKKSKENKPNSVEKTAKGSLNQPQNNIRLPRSRRMERVFPYREGRR